MDDKQPRQDGEKLTPEDLTQTSGAVRWLDNFWYHYKWPVIIGAFFAIVLIIGLVQIFSRPKTDVTLVNAYFYRMNREEREDFEKLLNRFVPEDYDGNGEKAVNLIAYEIFSEEEYYAAKAEAESVAAAESLPVEFQLNPKLNADERTNFIQFTSTGECSVYMVSPYLYQILLEGNRLRPLAEVYGGDPLPEGIMEDGCGIRLADTDFYRYSPAAQPIPEDTILCLYRPAIAGNQKNPDAYQHAVAFLRAIADFKVEE